MNKSKKILAAVCVALILAVAALIVVRQVRSRQRREAYSEAYALYQDGQYEQAAGIYAKLQDEAWLKNCDRGIAERDARALYDEGKPEEALALLRERAPESELRAALAEEYAAALIEAKDYEAALAALQVDAPESETVGRCERFTAQIAEEQAFRALAVEGAWDEANASLEKIVALNDETGRLTDRELEAMRYIAMGNYGSWVQAYVFAGSNEDIRRTVTAVLAANGFYSDAAVHYGELGDADGVREMLAAMDAKGEHGSGMFRAYQILGDADGMRAEAEWMLASGQYDRAYEAYEALEDADGKRAVIDAETAAGKLAEALNKLVQIEDYEQADALLARVPEEGSLLAESAGEGALACESALSTLMERGGDAALALASRIVDKVTEECRASIAQEKRCVPYYALGEVQTCAQALWTDELEALRNSCVEPMPEESFVLRDNNAQARPGDPGDTATITIYNESRAGLIFCLISKFDSDASRSIFVYSSPGMYTFTVRAGSYNGSVWKGDFWFGSKEGFGPNYRSTEIRVVDSLTGITQDNYLKGSYSITVK